MTGRCECDMRRLGERRQFAELRPGGRQRPSGRPASGHARQRHQRTGRIEKRRFPPDRIQFGRARRRIRRIRIAQRQQNHRFDFLQLELIDELKFKNEI